MRTGTAGVTAPSPVLSTTGTLRAADDAADARFWSREEVRRESQRLRASSREQVLAAIDELGEV